jgi:hypothetical protein
LPVAVAEKAARSSFDAAFTAEEVARAEAALVARVKTAGQVFIRFMVWAATAVVAGVSPSEAQAEVAAVEAA